MILAVFVLAVFVLAVSVLAVFVLAVYVKKKLRPTAGPRFRLRPTAGPPAQNAKAKFLVLFPLRPSPNASPNGGATGPECSSLCFSL